MNIEHLVRMANDIGAFFAVESGAQAARDIYSHIRRFWDPRMRKRIVAHYHAGGEGLDGPVRDAIALLAEEEPQAAASG
ncbi:MAG: formate dehydrogenase subunit delta [Proteobacteria bacterium]|nr:MAG: formate dehydrogenase subunit delta [Pseudomonadota bacterium]